MAKHTDRIEDSNLITLAKQKYETSQTSTLPTEIVYLPSQGKVYPKNHPLRSGKLEMRYMTAYDEDILTNQSYLNDGIILDKLLEALIVTDVNVGDIAVVDKDALIISARIVSYGAKYPVTVKDPNSKNILKRTVDLSTVKHKPFKGETDDNGEFEFIASDGTVIKYGYLLTKEQGNIESDKQKSSFLLNIIKQVNDTRSKDDILEFLKYKFLIKDSRQLQEHIINNAPGLDFNYEFEGENGSTFTATFPLGAELFWP